MNMSSKDLLNKISKITNIDSEKFRVELLFEDGSACEVSLAHIFTSPKGLASEIIRGNLFERCFVESGALAWPNGFELCPDSLKELAKNEQSKIRGSG